MKKPDGTDPCPPPDIFTTDTDRNTILMVNLKTSNGQIVNQNESILKEDDLTIKLFTTVTVFGEQTLVSPKCAKYKGLI